jgi:hypothetical protein
MVQKVFYNALDREENRTVEDLSSRELTILTPLLVLMIVLGVFPQPVLTRMEPSVRMVLERVEEAGGQLASAPGDVELETDGDRAVAGPESDVVGALPAPQAASAERARVASRAGQED